MNSFWKGFLHAFEGILYFSKGRNARVQMVAAVMVIIAAIIFKVSHTEWLIITIHIGAVLAAEAFNTSIETLSNHLSPERSQEIKTVKDVAAGAVLFIALSAFINALIIFLPKLIYW